MTAPAAPPAWRTVSVPVRRLRAPAGPNPNVMTAEEEAQLRANVRVTGCVQPVLARVLPGGLLPPPTPADPRHPTEAELVAESTWLLSGDVLEVVDGLHRLDAAVAVGLTAVPVTVVALTDAQATALRVGMNKLRGELDLTVVGRLLAELADGGAAEGDAALCGFDAGEIADLLAAVQPPDPEADAMAALGDPEPADSAADGGGKTYALEVRFAARSDRDRVKGELRALGGGDAARGLLALLDRADGAAEAE